MAFIEKYLIYILLAIIVALSILGGIQYVRVLHAKTTLAKQADQIVSLKKEAEDIQGQLADAVANVKAIKTASQVEQQISDNTADLRKKINLTQTNKCIGADDEKIFDSYIDYFNNGVRGATASDPKADEKVLSKADKTDSGKASSGSNWKIPEIENFVLTLIDYIGQLEQGTITCYESASD
jgi:hypothetical protein